MTTQNTIAAMRRCPTCGYSGDEEICPFDGTALRLVSQDSSPGSSESPQTDPSVTEQIEQKSEPTLKNPDFGRWQAPQATPGQRNLLGETIGERYVVQSILGQGGMGTVYAAHQKSVDRSVAIKVLNREFSENDHIIRRFHQEALAASKLSDPHTISIFDFGQTGSLLYIVMEHLRGRTLKDLLSAEGQIPLDRTLTIILQVLQSIVEAHEKGIIHRDLKPENIFLMDVDTQSDFVKVLDFGVAKLKPADGSEGTLTQMGLIFGTPKYMAPEQSSNLSVDPRADVYSVGVILYEMLMGTPPFEGENPLSVILAHSKDRVDRFKTRRPDLDLPAISEAIILKSLSKDREERYGSARELADALLSLKRAIKTDTVAQSTASFPRIEELEGYQTVASMELDLADEPYSSPTQAQAKPIFVWGLAILTIIAGTFLWRTQAEPDIASNDSGAAGFDSEIDRSIPMAESSSSQTRAPLKKSVQPKIIPRKFVLDVKPQGSLIYDHADGTQLGTTPWTGELTTSKILRAEKTGYESQIVVIDPKNEKNDYAVTLKKEKRNSAKPRPQKKKRPQKAIEEPPKFTLQPAPKPISKPRSKIQRETPKVDGVNELD